MPRKTLLVFCDGTGKDGSLYPPRTVVSNSQTGVPDGTTLNPVPAPPQDPNATKEQVHYPTNVLRLSRSVLPTDREGKRQIVFYQSGVDSEVNFEGEQVLGSDVLKALGTAVASKIRDVYVFIAQNYEEGDEICLFGFSRGAYIARKLSGLIDAIGLLAREYLSYFFQTWSQLIAGQKMTRFKGTRCPSIKVVGVWDTVGSVYNEIDALRIKDTSLPPTVKIALHAVSIQENRENFLPTLWTIPAGGLKPDQVLKQVWFPGAHSDVGGGYERHELADIALFWMAGEIQDLVNLDLGFIQSYTQPSPNPWGASQPHNAWDEPAGLEGIIYETRLKSGDITPQSEFHQSWRFAPRMLDSPKQMVTMNDIIEKFGGHFEPRYATMNEFEEYCKKNWGVPPEKGSLITSPHGIEDPGLIFSQQMGGPGNLTVAGSGPFDSD